MAEPSNTTPPNLKPYAITNIKSYVPLILDLNELNYDAWRELFHTHCVGFGVSGHLDGSVKSKGKDDDEWTTLDAIVKSWIYGTLTQPLLNMILLTSATPTAQSVWTDLERLFRDNRDARAIELDNEIRSLEMGDMSVTDYCQKLKVLSDLLRNIGQPVPATTLLTHLLNGLSPKFEKILPVIQHHNPPVTFLQARSMLLLEEKRLQRHRTPSATHTDHSSSSTALHTSSPSNSNRNNNSSQQPSNRNNSNNNSGRGGGRGGRDGRGRGRGSGRGGRAQWQPQQWPQFPPWFWSYPMFQTAQQGRPRRPDGLLGAGPAGHQQHQQAAYFAAPPSPGLTPPWGWFPSVQSDQETNLDQAFHSMSINDNNSDAQWYMDTSATSHLASSTGSLDSFFS